MSVKEIESFARYLACLAAGLCGLAANAAEEVVVEAQRRADAVEVRCRATVNAPLDLVWRTLTDYDRLATFIPGMRSSRILERHGATTIVEQSGEARFLFLSYPIEVTVASTERAPREIHVQLLKGNLRTLEGSYRVEQLADGRVALAWHGLIAPDAYLPPLVGEMLMRANIGDQFLGMVREIERREALRRNEESRQ